MLYPNVSMYAQAPTLAFLLGQKLISGSRWYEAINDSLKRFFPPVLDEGHAVRGHTFLVDSLRRHGIPRPKRVFEQGTGWHGSDVLAFYLLGADRIFTTDTSRWLRKDSLDRTAGLLMRSRTALRPVYEEYLGNDIGEFDARLDRLQARNGDTSELFGTGLIEYMVNRDLCLNPADFDSFDLVFSNSVLQRLPVPELRQFLKAKRVPGAVHLHRIDCADFQAMRNRRLNKLAYLLIDERSWNRWSSQYLNYQNRLRSFEFVTLFRTAGYEPALRDEYAGPESVAFVQEHWNDLSRRYNGCDGREIATTNFTLIARPSQASTDRRDI
jgi:hypothetical protein